VDLENLANVTIGKKLLIIGKTALTESEFTAILFLN